MNEKTDRDEPWEVDNSEFIFKWSDPKRVKAIAELFLEATKKLS
jgi:hypothetical protein